MNTTENPICEKQEIQVEPVSFEEFEAIRLRIEGTATDLQEASCVELSLEKNILNYAAGPCLLVYVFSGDKVIAGHFLPMEEDFPDDKNEKAYNQFLRLLMNDIDVRSAKVFLFGQNLSIDENAVQASADKNKQQREKITLDLHALGISESSINDFRINYTSTNNNSGDDTLYDGTEHKIYWFHED